MYDGGIIVSNKNIRGGENMNAVLEEKKFDVNEAVHEEYEDMPHEKVIEGTRALIEQHMEALRALANV